MDIRSVNNAKTSCCAFFEKAGNAMKDFFSSFTHRVKEVFNKVFDKLCPCRVTAQKLHGRIQNLSDMNKAFAEQAELQKQRAENLEQTIQRMRADRLAVVPYKAPASIYTTDQPEVNSEND